MKSASMAESKLSDLIAGLEAAAEGSRLLSAEVFCAAHDHTLVGWSNDWAPGGFIYVRPSGASVFSSGDDHAAFTTSLDAIVALIERKLPGWIVRLDMHPTGSEASVEPAWKSLDRPRSKSIWVGQAHRAPLALCIALLRALQLQGGSEQ